MRLALLVALLASPALAAPQASIHPSTIDVEATLLHDRDTLTKHVCEKRMASAAAVFARQAPRSYTPYKSLQFKNEPHDEPSGAIAAVRFLPGRTWHLRAVVGTMSVAVREFGIEPHLLGSTWTMLDSTRGIVAVRREGPHVGIVMVETERWDELNDRPAHHPVAALFFEQMIAAADKCLAT